ncbi:MAG: glycosyltransferase [Candidatus Hydrothermarchaeales archaeon]
MRVLLVTQWKPKRGGVVAHVENLMKHSMNEFEILTYEKYVDLPILRALSFLVYGLVKGLRTECDLIHAHYAVPQGLLGVILKKIKGKPLIVTVHGSDITVLGRNSLARPFVRFTLKSADAVIAVSNFLKGETSKLGVAEEKIQVVYNGLPVGKEVQKESLNIEGTIIAYIGSLVPQKGVDVLLQAFENVKREIPEAKLVIVGEGREEKKLLRLARKIGLLDVYFLGQRDDLNSVLEGSSLLVLPSREEGFGMILLEAMHMGVPVVASRTGGIPEVVGHGKNGLLVERENPEALAKEIISVLKDDALKERLIVNGRKTAERFSWESASNEVDGLYEEIRGSAGP